MGGRSSRCGGAHPAAETYSWISPREVSPLRPTARPTTCRATPGYAELRVVQPTSGYIEAHGMLQVQTSGCSIHVMPKTSRYIFCCVQYITHATPEVDVVLPKSGGVLCYVGGWVLIMPLVKVRFKETRKTSFLARALCLFSYNYKIELYIIVKLPWSPTDSVLK